ncbi:DUF3429 domain-containing protein [Marinicella litoralis]|nr:DUF3429 domain-containing protein [Marinicella litoralis]
MKTALKPKTLTYLGAIPFILALLIASYGYFNLDSLLGHEVRFTRFKSYFLAHTYGAVIVAFLAGIQWGSCLNQTNENNHFIISTVLALMAWSSLFAFASFIGVLTILITLVLALLVDRHAFRKGLIPAWFWLLRIRISLMIILTLSLLLMINK